MSAGARFWAVDCHVHTPASRDVDPTTYGAATPEEVVRAAIDADLDAIAITDHNTSAWCEAVASAAQGSALVILPGIEISTAEGHLLAIWEEGTPSTVLDELLIRLGIGNADQGKLNVATQGGFASTAKEVAASGGLAIPAHIDRPKGLLGLSVAAHLRQTLNEPSVSAVEVASLASVAEVHRRIGNARNLACVRGSDMTLPGNSIHTLSGIGTRRTWIKASRPDLRGLKHALEDCELRVQLLKPDTPDLHPYIESVAFTGGFLDGAHVELSPDLNCLLGGTGAGKSLVLEAIRYTLGQQVRADTFPAIAKEVSSRLEFALGPTGVIRLTVKAGGERYELTRAFTPDLGSPTEVYREEGGAFVSTDLAPHQICRISAFSQGEALEYSREPTARMSLIDSGLALGDLPSRESDVLDRLRTNATELINQREMVAALETTVAAAPALATRVEELARLFTKDIVNQQDNWQKELSRLKQIQKVIPAETTTAAELAPVNAEPQITANEDLFRRVAAILDTLRTQMTEHQKGIATAVAEASRRFDELREEWQARFDAFKIRLDAELSKVAANSTTAALRKELERLQGQLAELQTQKDNLSQTETPKLTQLTTARELLLTELRKLREERRDLRRERAASLNRVMGGIVKLDIPAKPGSADFRSALETLKTGSRVRAEVLDALANHVDPFEFARRLLRGDVTPLVGTATGIDAHSLERLVANIEDRKLWMEVCEAQICERPDQLAVKFLKPDDHQYVEVEKLAHGQRCTAILVVLLADGVTPVVVDQPEDALHAPWIEDYLVDRLRQLRGQRQYIFATRSPGIVVGGDAEQIVTMKASAGRGEIEATGSLERYDLNKLALYHLEGGPEAFRRRGAKLDISVRGTQ